MAKVTIEKAEDDPLICAPIIKGVEFQAVWDTLRVSVPLPGAIASTQWKLPPDGAMLIRVVGGKVVLEIVRL